MVTLQPFELKTAQMLYALNPYMVNETLNPTAPSPEPLPPSGASVDTVIPSSFLSKCHEYVT